MRSLHTGFAWFVLVSNFGAAVWALIAQWRTAQRARPLHVALGVAYAAVFVQAFLGVALDREREGAQIHMFYGFLMILSIAILYGYRHQLGEWVYLAFGLGGLWITGLGVRAMFLG